MCMCVNSNFLMYSFPSMFSCWSISQFTMSCFPTDSMKPVLPQNQTKTKDKDNTKKKTADQYFL